MTHFAHALFSETRFRILEALFLVPERRWHLRRIARETGLPYSNVRRELDHLTSAQILSEWDDDGRLYYTANANHPIASDLRSILVKTRVVGPLQELLKCQPLVRVAFIYGSVATGRDNAESDIDLCVVSEKASGDLEDLLADLESSLGRTIELIRLSPGQVADPSHFVRRILAGAKIYVKGDEEQLRRLEEK